MEKLIKVKILKKWKDKQKIIIKINWIKKL